MIGGVVLQILDSVELDPCGGLLLAFWGPWESSWGLLGSLLGALWRLVGASLGDFLRETAMSDQKIASRRDVVGSWSHLGPLMGRPWPSLAASWGPLRTFSKHLQPHLRPPWASEKANCGSA